MRDYETEERFGQQSDSVEGVADCDALPGLFVRPAMQLPRQNRFLQQLSSNEASKQRCLLACLHQPFAQHFSLHALAFPQLETLHCDR